MKKPPTHQDLAALPKALRPLADEKRWVNWAWTARPGKDGATEWTKPPLQPRDPRVHAKSNDAATWSTYDRALKRARDGDADGIGYMLLDADLGAVDLDHCCVHDLKSNGSSRGYLGR